MKKLIKLFIFCLLVIPISCESQQKNNNNRESPEETLINFYTEYLTLCDEIPINSSEVEKKYVTVSLLKKISDLRKDYLLDFDPYINAQDCDSQWLKSLTIINNPHEKNVFYVSYFTFYEESYNTIKIIVGREEGKYKINDLPALNKVRQFSR